MSIIWTEYNNHLLHLINENQETQMHFYLEQLMLFPVDIQDKIIEEISSATLCTNEAIVNIITHYTMLERREAY